MKLKTIILSALLLLGAAYWLVGKHLNADPNNDTLKTVVITQIVDHPSLNQARKGAMAALSDAGYIPGKNIKLIESSAQGNLSLASQLAHQYNQLKPDVIISISTTSSQTLLAANSNHNPIVFSSVTDPLAAKLIPNLKHPGGDVTGTSESPPIKALLELMTQVLPKAKAIGVIYHPGEINSRKTVEMLKTLTPLKIVEAPVNQSMDVRQAFLSLVSKVDVIILPSDNMIWPSLSMLTQLATDHGIPILTNDPDSALQGVTIALGYAQYDIGYHAGNQSVSILQGAKVGTIPVSPPEKPSLIINLDRINAMGISLDKSLLKKADRLVSRENNA